MNRPRLPLAAALLAVALIGAACGGSSTSDDPETTTTGDTQATTTTAAATTTDGGATTTAGETSTSTGGGAVELEIGAIDNEGFTRDRLEGPTGTDITVVFDNQDVGGEPHNWHIVIASGAEEYATKIAVGPDKQEVTFTIGVAGDYNYFCDTHSETMKGVLTAAP